MRVAWLAMLVVIPLSIAACPLPNTSTSGNNTCPTTDDAGSFEGALYTLYDGGELSVDLDAGNGGLDLGASRLPDGGAISHVYLWPCITTFDCETARDASITFTSPDGVSDWSVAAMTYGTGSDCVAPVVDSGPAAVSCCITCDANSQPCGGTCISIYQQCGLGVGPGCACQ